MTDIDPVASPFEAATSSAARLAERTGIGGHDVAVVLGSGWKPAAERMGEVVAEVALADLGGFPASTVEGHGSQVRSIVDGDRRILAFTGRVHLYEGHHVNQVVHGVRTAVAAGCRVIVLTNAAGALRDDLRIGQAVVIGDHLNLTGRSPLTGPNDERLGRRFPDLTHAYSPRLRELAHAVDPTLVEAVYGGFAGPQYETPAEVRMARTLGAELVGMSTVLETIAAVHAGADVLALSLVTNLAAGLGAGDLTHDDVLAAGTAAADRMGVLIAAVVARL